MDQLEKNNIPGFDDLIFEFRNKDYGAYQLRKKYSRVLLGGTLLSIAIGCCAVIIPFLIKPSSDRILSGGSGFVQLQMDNLEPPVEEIYIPPPPRPPEAAGVQEIVKYVPPEIVDTIIPFEKTIAVTDELIAHSGETPIETAGMGFGEDFSESEGGLISDEPFFLVEVMPSFRGGDINKFREWVQRRTNYPQEAVDRKIQGRVFLTFIIETDGAVSNVTVVKGIDPLIDNEAVKAIEGSPRWSPGLQRGQPVRVRYSMWLSFVI